MCQNRSIFQSTVAVLLFLVGMFAQNATAQMPDWILVRDPDGNRYHVDPNGRIYTSGKPEFDFKPVSEEGIAFYYSQGIELLRSGYKVEGLTLLKSILAMPGDGRTADYRARVSADINRLIRREGDRYLALNRDASVLLYREKGAVVLVNDLMKYRIEFPRHVSILRRGMRGDSRYEYYGLLVGVRFGGDTAVPPAGAYDALVAIDGESFPYDIRTMDALKRNWARNLGADTFKRTPIRSNESTELARFDDNTLYAGYEAFFLRGRYGYCVRIIAARSGMETYGPGLETMINSFRLSFVKR